MKILTAPRLDRCIGCHSCSLACARQVYKRLSWAASGIRIHSAGGLSTGFIGVLCVACDPAPCARACPSNALRQRPGGGAVLRRSACIRCGACVEACPVDAIYRDDAGDIFLCLHCGSCVSFCPHQCLEFKDTREVQRSFDHE